MTTSTFTPRTVATLAQQSALPGFLVAGWLKATGQNIGFVAADLIYKDNLRKLKGAVLTILTIILCLATLYGMKHMNPSANRFTHVQTTEESLNFLLALVGAVGAFCVGFIAFMCFRFTPDAYWDFEAKEEGFGWNLDEIMNVLGKTLEELRGSTFEVTWTIADRVLVNAAKKVLVTESALLERFKDTYLKPDWKYEPKWDEAKKCFERSYYMFERFALADPNGFDSYYQKAREELAQNDGQ